MLRCLLNLGRKKHSSNNFSEPRLKIAITFSHYSLLISDLKVCTKFKSLTRQIEIGYSEAEHCPVNGSNRKLAGGRWGLTRMMGLAVDVVVEAPAREPDRKHVQDKVEE